MAAPDIYAASAKHRRELLALERKAASAMVRTYGVAWKRIQTRLDSLQTQWDIAVAAGEKAPEVWLRQYGRLSSLQRQIEAEMHVFAGAADTEIVAAQRAAIDTALKHAPRLMDAALGARPAGVNVAFHRLPVEAMTDLIGFLRDGSPLRSLLEELGAPAAKAMADALTNGMALGKGPRAVAREMRREAGVSLTRALRISRTEILRADREASRRTFEANPETCTGWVWISAMTPGRTCAACWAMHGTVHPLTEPMADHPQGRCTMGASSKSWEELGFQGVPDKRPQIEAGADAFAKLTPAQQDATLGAAGGAAYREGKVTLQDFLATRRSAVWGETKSARSIGGALEAAKERGPAATPAAPARAAVPRMRTVEEVRTQGETLGAKLDDWKAWRSSEFGNIDGVLTKEEERGLRDYFGLHYRTINEHLRGINVVEDKEFLSSIDAAVRGANKGKLSRDALVYRGRHSAQSHSIGDVLSDNGFLSTSFNKNEAKSWITFEKGTTYEAFLPKGTRGMPAFSGMEQEFLLPPGARFRVVGIEGTETHPHYILELIEQVID